jgi:hypothetical protein
VPSAEFCGSGPSDGRAIGACLVEFTNGSITWINGPHAEACLKASAGMIGAASAEDARRVVIELPQRRLA